MNQLEKARTQIDQIDQQMAQLFEARMQQVEQVILYKQQNQMPILDTGREAAVVEKNLARLQSPQLAEYYADFIRHQMALSRQYQASVLGRDRVAYQGVEGAFSHLALKQLFPRAKAISYPTWDEVFDAVEQGTATYGVLPFENSHAGDVSAVLDLCYARGLFITQMCDLSVCHHLLGLQTATLGDVTQVVSHAQAISQCEKFLKSVQLTAQAYPNTALAAQHVAQSGDASLAAIASEETAELYGLKILAQNINTDGDNTTRFIVVSKQRPEAGNRFSLLFTVDHKAGQLARVIQAIGAAGLNMENIKSRPMPHVPFEYYFYVELVGDVSTPATQQLLQQLEQICHTVRILGVFSK